MPCLLAMLGAAPVAAVAQEPLVLARLSGPITLDGPSDEPAWEAIEPLPVSVLMPDPGAAPSERTEFRVAYDDEYLYAAGRLFDSEPEGLRVASLRRDVNGPNNDWFAVVIDAYDDGRTTLCFFTTPAGTRTDTEFQNDGTALNRDWNTHWDVAVKRTGEGWFAEMRIPLSSLRFQEKDGRVVMGLTLWRSIARKNETITFPAISPRWGGAGAIMASQTRRVVLQGIRPRNVLQVTPYLLGGAGWTPSSDASAAGVGFRRRDLGEAGLSLKYAPTTNLVLDLTVNTDFAQVEADDQQINLTRFSLFVPEKRPFFQERAGAFAFETGDGGRLFHSRRIGVEEGRAVPILGGARMVGRIGEWDVALLAMETDELDSIAGARFGTVRLRRRVLDQHSYVGAIATGRVGPDAGAWAVGADASLRIFGRDDLLLTGAASGGEHPAGSALAADRSLVRARLERRGEYGLHYAFEAARVGGTFDPPIGFIPRTGHSRARIEVGHGWRAAERSRMQDYTLWASGTAYRRTRDGTLESGEIAAGGYIVMRTGSWVDMDVRTVHENVADTFTLSRDVEVPAGTYRFHDALLTYSTPASALAKAVFDLGGGTFYDGWRASLGTTASWSVSRHLELGGTYRATHVRFDERRQRMTAHLARLRGRLMFSPRLSLSAFAQYHSTARQAGVNVRLRYNPAEGHDLYVVFDQGLDGAADGARAVPSWKRGEHSLIIKYSRAIRLGVPR